MSQPIPAASEGDRTQMRRLRVVAVGFIALLFLAAAVDGRNGVLDHTRSDPARAARAAPLPTTGELIADMLGHD